MGESCGGVLHSMAHQWAYINGHISETVSGALQKAGNRTGVEPQWKRSLRAMLFTAYGHPRIIRLFKLGNAHQIHTWWRLLLGREMELRGRMWEYVIGGGQHRGFQSSVLVTGAMSYEMTARTRDASRDKDHKKWKFWKALKERSNKVEVSLGL